MSTPKQLLVSKRKLFLALISIALICSLASGSIMYVVAQGGSTPITISSGIYPGAPTYTIWVDSGTYYSKTAYGVVSSSTNAATFINSMILTVHSTTNGTIKFAPGLYTLTSPIIMYSKVSLVGEEVGFDNLNALTATGVTFYFQGLSANTPCINFQTNSVNYATISGITVFTDSSVMPLILKVGGNEDPDDCSQNNFYNNQFHGNVVLGSSAYYNTFTNVEIVTGSLILNGSATSGSSRNIFNEVSMHFLPTFSGAISNAVYLNYAGGNTFNSLYITSTDPSTTKTLITLTFSARNQFYGLYFDGVGDNEWTILNFDSQSFMNTIFVTNSESAIGIKTAIDSSYGNIIYDRGVIRLPQFTTNPDTTGWNGNQAGSIWYSMTDNATQYWDGSRILRATLLYGYGETTITGSVNQVSVLYSSGITDTITGHTPVFIGLSEAYIWGVGNYEVIARNSTGFDIYFENQPGASTWIFDWFAIY
jgi:hypothetical protein